MGQGEATWTMTRAAGSMVWIHEAGQGFMNHGEDSWPWSQSQDGVEGTRAWRMPAGAGA